MVPIDTLYQFLPIRGFFFLLWTLLAFFVLYKAFNIENRLMRNGVIGLTFVAYLSPVVWKLYAEHRFRQDAREVYRQFEILCFDKASARIFGRVQSPKLFVFSPRSPVRGAYGFELFYPRLGPPKLWGHTKVVTKRPATGQEGTIEVSYTYLTEERTISGTNILIRGVRQKIVDLSTQRVLGERTNYILGTEFVRGATCLDIEWYSGSTSFLEQVLGPRYPGGTSLDHLPWPKPSEHLKATLVATKPDDIELHNYAPAELLPEGSEYDYNDSEIRLPQGKFRMISFRGGEPLPIVAVVNRPDYYVFVLLPHGSIRSRPPREILFNYRLKNGDQVKNVFVQIPPGIDWAGGWGLDPRDVRISKAEIEFELLGAKTTLNFDSPDFNRGRYTKRYRYRVMLPESH